ncbi:MAG: HRDC domain-containing protein [Actinobacteria bacterium]|nr:HRDC domain-containing protein [Actinomycetota bacterium]MBV9664607.1 HRDC domain-containing protein [Actinomycetota bacterium]MBV9933983.1 HRDC domain-containing protein [Actinomycetota bacterium]
MTSAEWIADPGGLEDLCNALLKEPAYALDTEFHRERTYYPHLALLQVAFPGRLVLVDPLDLDLAPLAPVLSSDAVFVAHASEQDLEVLLRACNALPTTLFDTQVAAGFLGFSSPSLSTLVEQLLHVKLPKGDRLTNWTRRPLTDAQKDYAASDVVHLLEIRELIVAQLEKDGRLEWAEQECAVQLQRAAAVSDPTTAWWRLKETRTLRGKSRCVAQEVAQWREHRAMALDIPTRFVLSDMAILGIAHRPPASARELRDIRGLEGRPLKGDAVEELLAAVRRGKELDESQLRLPQRDDLDPALRPAVALVSAWIAQLARDVRIDASLLATRADLHALLRGDTRGRLSHGWRSHLLGEPIRRLVDGEAAVAFDGKGDLVVEKRSRQPITGE